MQGPMGIPSNQTAAFGRGASRVAREIGDAGQWLAREAAISAAMGGGLGALFRHGRRLAGLRKMRFLSPAWERRAKVAAEGVQLATQLTDGEEQRPAIASDPGKLGAQRQLAGRGRMLKDGKLQKLNGRQMWMSDDGEVQTEYTITIKMPNGGYANVPSFNPRTGQNYPTERAALEGARNEGYVIKTFPTAKKAALAAEYKSQKLGVQLRGMGY